MVAIDHVDPAVGWVAPHADHAGQGVIPPPSLEQVRDAGRVGRHLVLKPLGVGVEFGDGNPRDFVRPHLGRRLYRRLWGGSGGFFFSSEEGARSGSFAPFEAWFHSSTSIPCASSFFRWALTNLSCASLTNGMQTLLSLLLFPGGTFQGWHPRWLTPQRDLLDVAVAVCNGDRAHQEFLAGGLVHPGIFRRRLRLDVAEGRVGFVLREAAGGEVAVALYLLFDAVQLRGLDRGDDRSGAV